MHTSEEALARPRSSRSWVTSTTDNSLLDTSAARGRGGRGRRHHAAHRAYHAKRRAVITFLAPSRATRIHCDARGACAGHRHRGPRSRGGRRRHAATKEASSARKAPALPIVVAVNKIDKHGPIRKRSVTSCPRKGSLPGMGRREHLRAGVRQKGDGIDKLLESILLQAEVLELPCRKGRAGGRRRLEASVERGRGAVATVLSSAAR